MKKLALLTVLAMFASILVVSASSANVIPTIGNGVLYTSSDVPTAHNSTIYAVNEQQGFTLGSNLEVGDALVGTYSSWPSKTTLAGGTAVNSHFLLFIPEDGIQSATATFTFDQDIIGIMVESAQYGNTLGNSDFLSVNAWSSIYDVTKMGRGMEMNGSSVVDQYTISDARTISVDLMMASGGWMDQMRVITTASGLTPPGPGVIPEPTSILMVALGLLGVFGFNHNKFRK